MFSFRINIFSMLCIFLCIFSQVPLTTPTKVHLVLNSHNDLTWGMNFDEIYNGTGGGAWAWVCVKCLLEDLTQILSENSNRTFTLTEMYFVLVYYNENKNNTKGEKLKNMIKNKQLIIGQAGLSIPDEATTHYDEIIDQLTYGSREAYELFDVRVEDGWALDVFGNSYTNREILRQYGVNNIIVDRISDGERLRRMKTQELQFFSGSKDFLVHAIPYRYGSQVNSYRNRQDLENLIKLTNTSYQNPTDLLVILADDFKKWNKEDFQTIEQHIYYYKSHPELGIDLFYSSAHEYFKNRFQSLQKPNNNMSITLQDHSDFYPLVDYNNKPWVGYFTTRQILKLMVRRFGLLSRSLKNMFGIMKFEAKKNEIGLDPELYNVCVNDMEWHIGFLTHHDTITGTLGKESERDVKRRTYIKERACRKKIEESDVFQNFTYCNLLFNNNSCILDFFMNNTDFNTDFQGGKKKLDVRIFNPSQKKKDLISLRIPDLNMKVTLQNGSLIESDSFCENANGLECYLYIQTILPGFDFLEILLSVDSNSTTQRNVTQILANDSFSLDLNFGFSTNFTIASNFSRFYYTNDKIFKNFTIDFKYYESKKTNNCYFFKFNGDWANTCTNHHDYTGAYVMRLENGMPRNFKDEMAVSAFYYRTKFFMRITFQFNNNTIISQLTFYPDYNTDPEVFVIDSMTFLNDNIDLEFSRINGKEITLTVKDEDIKNNGTFYTDSNGLYEIQRKKNTPTANPSADIPLNYFPVVSKISIRNLNNASLSLLNDRSQGGTSFREGEVELMITRYYNTDDWLGLCEGLWLQEKSYIHHQIVLQNYDKIEKNRTIVKITNRKNYIYLPFVKIHVENQVATSKFDNFVPLFADSPEHLKINLHPLRNNNTLLIRVQDVYNPFNNESKAYVANISDSLKNVCSGLGNNCSHHNYTCKLSQMDGFDAKDNNISWIDGSNGIPHAILTLFCDSGMRILVSNSANGNSSLRKVINFLYLGVAFAVLSIFN